MGEGESEGGADVGREGRMEGRNDRRKEEVKDWPGTGRILKFSGNAGYPI